MKGGGFRERGDCKHYVTFKGKKGLYKNQGNSNTMLEWHLLE